MSSVNLALMLSLDILEQRGNVQLYPGMPLKKLREIALSFTHGKHYRTSGGFFSSHFIFGEGIKVVVSIDPVTETATVKSIEFFGEYQGKFDGIGIGSSVADLLKARQDVFFDEQYILVKKNYPYDFIIKVDNEDATIRSLEEVMDNKIISIAVEG